ARATIDISDVDIHDNGCGIFSRFPPGRIRLSNVTIRDNTHSGIANATSVSGEDVTVTDNGDDGIAGVRVKLERLVATGNGSTGILGGAGVWAGAPLRLVDSTVTGNNGYKQGFDLISRRPPRLDNVTCGTSGRTDAGQPMPSWSVCAND